MKYITLNNGYDFINEKELLNALLKNRGVDNPRQLLDLNEQVVHDGMLLKNMDEALNLLHKYIEKSKDEIVNIHIIIDSDCDGYTSSAYVINYLNDLIKNNKLKINITYSLHKGKEHGIIIRELENYNFDLLIVPDAGSNDVKECNILKEQGKDILILDHHDIDTENKCAIVVNCKDKQYPNETLAGVGVVHKFFKEYDKKYGYNFANKYIDLVALGCIGDTMDLRNYETRYLVLKGLENIKNDFIKYMIKEQSYSLKDEITIMGVGWYIAPLINAVVRSGTQEEKEDTFKALIGVNELREYKPRKSKNNPNPQIQQQPLQEFMARVCKNVKGRQDREVKKGLIELNKKITEKKLNDNKILVVDCENIIDKTFTGLMANKLTSQYKKPVIVLRKKEGEEGVFGGSCRNYKLSPIVNLKEFLDELNTFNELSGHGNAFGFKITLDNIIKTVNRANEKLKDIKIEDVYKVDYEVPIGRLKPKHITQVGQWSNLWGNKLDEPLFAITDIYISTEDIKLMGSKKNIIRFDKKIGSNQITFIKFFANEDTYNKMIMKQKRGLSTKQVKKVKIDVIGKFKINKWQETEYPQIEIIDFNVSENKDFIF